MDYNLILILLLSYLIGSIPTGVIISKVFFGFDIRTQGSGNMGSTNVFRVLGTKWGIFVQLADIIKGIVAVVLTAYLFNPVQFSQNFTLESNSVITQFVAGMAAVLGHIFSIFVKFKGGKGVNTAFGLIVALVPIDATFALIVFIIVVMLTGYVSLSSILGASTLPISMLIRTYFFGANIEGYNIIIYFAFSLALIIIITHIKNIGRLINGTEHSFEKLKILRKK
jgi:glycerol-3-phosphate acyltransferase PlsY